ncbi:stalk domain-containing protein [Anaerosphaera multitolerans]|uniref:TNase-like domain-containing protein n=1 Tax=Anaerosphaera multitolerans TaxID=2487351 RepID=A0A437S4U8_9FIRM|nr:stalk domain-containing protein [Anaerosphaera multitolerans]RVU54008.1 hypothetical protein EF514_09540 [Anaerosphaera multitolerans]
MKKRLMTLILTFTIALGLFPNFTNAQTPIRIWYNGNYINSDVNPFIENNRTLVPIRSISENLGYEVKWDDSTKKITIQDAEVHIELTVGETIAKSKRADKSQTLTLDVPAKIKENRTFVPLRFIAEQFGANVNWDSDNRTVAIGDNYIKPETVDTLKNTNTFQEALVTRVIDGDTIEININGVKEKVRMVLVNTPETKHPTKGVEFFGQEASAFTTEELTGKKVYLQKDVSERDRYDRLLRYIWTSRPFTDEPTKDEVIQNMFNAKLIANGYGNVSTFPPDVKYQELFQNLENEAKNQGWGLWQQSLEIETVKTSPAKSNLEETPQSYSYVGNRNSKIFHRDNCVSAGKMKDSNKVPLNSREDALAQGYRPCKNCNP